MKNTYDIVLAGNPNSGKTTLFNRLTGSHYKVGNYGGVTVEKKSGRVKGDTLSVCDTPGIYSFSERRAEEEAAKGVIRGGCGLIINVVDASSLSRSLLLTSELAALSPVIIALNMYDGYLADGGGGDFARLSSLIGVEIFIVNAKTGEGLRELISRAKEIINGGRLARPKISEMKGAEIRAALARAKIGKNEKRIGRAERLLCNPLFALPLFILIIALLLTVVFGAPGTAAGEFVTALFEHTVIPAFERMLPSGGFVRALFIDGILKSTAGILSFLPQIMLLFFFLSCLDAVGYMSRVCFALDSLLCKLGLDGRAAIPLVLGFGCSVTAVMSARTLEGEGGRRAMIAFSPLVSCSARNAVFAVMISAFFPHGKALIITGLYVLGVAAVLFCCFIFGRARREKTPPFITELPPPRLPDFKYIFTDCFIKGRDFLFKACAIIIPASAVIFALSYFTPVFLPAEDGGSILDCLCKKIAPFFSPLGFGDSRAAAALISGIFAKESIVSSMTVLFGEPLGAALAASGFTPASALSFCVFSLFYFPCAATVAAIARESKSAAFTIKTLALHFAIAYLLSFITYRVAGCVI